MSFLYPVTGTIVNAFSDVTGTTVNEFSESCYRNYCK